MKSKNQQSFKLLCRDAFIASLLIFGVLFLVKTLILSINYLNPITKSFEDFEFTDLYYSNLREKSLLVNKDIVLVNIGRESRQSIAKQIEILNKYQPKVIGLDALFTELKDSATDEFLTKMIHDATNIVLINEQFYNNDTKESTILSSLPLFTHGISQGFANFLSKKDQTIRLVAPSIILNGNEYESFSSEIVKKYSPHAYQVLKQRGREAEIIHYQNENFIKIDVEDLNHNPYLEDIIKGKIVLMGFMGDYLGDQDLEDLHLTPLNKSYGGHAIPDKYGVEIHAHIISMILKENYINRIPSYVNFPLILLITFLHMLLFIYVMIRHEKWSSFITKLVRIISFSLLLLFSLILFYYFRIKVEPAFLLIVVIFSLEILSIYRSVILWLANKLNFRTYFN
ncbi:MAG: CHASE2 domain-containing protein [Brumimicrobium sp.]|nr:CHASE2 domain-containing protein [Brumimicrobium sp.]